MASLSNADGPPATTPDHDLGYEEDEEEEDEEVDDGGLSNDQQEHADVSTGGQPSSRPRSQPSEGNLPVQDMKHHLDLSKVKASRAVQHHARNAAADRRRAASAASQAAKEPEASSVAVSTTSNGGGESSNPNSSSSSPPAGAGTHSTAANASAGAAASSRYDARRMSSSSSSGPNSSEGAPAPPSSSGSLPLSSPSVGAGGTTTGGGVGGNSSSHVPAFVTPRIAPGIFFGAPRFDKSSHAGRAGRGYFPTANLPPPSATSFLPSAGSSGVADVDNDSKPPTRLGPRTVEAPSGGSEGGFKRQGSHSSTEGDHSSSEGSTTPQNSDTTPTGEKTERKIDGAFLTLPDMANAEPGAPTSRPARVIQRGLDESIRQYMDISAFERLMREPIARDRLREYLDVHGSSSSAACLTLYQDAINYDRFLEEFRLIGASLHANFVDPDAPRPAQLPIEVAQAALAALKMQERYLRTSPFAAAAKLALETLYRDEFSQFVREKIAQQARMRLGVFPSQQERGDLGDVFCLTDPRLPDSPIVMASDGFCRLTGYDREQIISRNCRFLQGPSTDVAAVRRIRDAIKSGKPVCEIILNYKADGAPFWNCLSLIPVKNASNRIELFIGGQVDISEALANNQTLSFLVGSSDSVDDVDDDENGDGENGSDSTRGANDDGSTLVRFSQEVVSTVERALGHRSVFGLSGETDELGRSRGSATGGGGVGGTGTRFENRRSSNLRLPPFVAAAAAAAQQEVGDDRPLERMPTGTEVYSRLLLVSTVDFDIRYVTAGLLLHLGFPISTPKQVYASPLLHHSLLDVLRLPTQRETSKLIVTVRTVFERGVSYSVRAGLRQNTANSGAAASRRRGWFVDESGTRLQMGLIHLTPLRDYGGRADMFAVVFG